MTVDTTVVMNGEVRAALERASRSSGETVSALIVLAMKRTMAGRGGLARAFQRVEYQGRGREWRRRHVSVWARDYEFFIDMRKVFKRSVSLLIALSVEWHLEAILEELSKTGSKVTDNYLFQSYIMCEEIIDSCVCWKLFWGIPQNPLKIFQ
jgi:hypothetical protein